MDRRIAASLRSPIAFACGGLAAGAVLHSRFLAILGPPGPILESLAAAVGAGVITHLVVAGALATVRHAYGFALRLSSPMRHVLVAIITAALVVATFQAAVILRGHAARAVSADLGPTGPIGASQIPSSTPMDAVEDE